MIFKPWEYQLDLDMTRRELQAEYDAGVIGEDIYQTELAAIYKQMDEHMEAV